ncbi:MAG: fructose-bisphosphate aldolase, partial [Alphaproteobacteria bacterium]|nr:fructose-bisphosphate aldolase [Alphaproteobacteria bacterium]
GSPESFRHVTSNCPAPILVAGGPKDKSLRDSFELAKGSIEGGAAGLIFGRNIWQSDNPAGMVKALRHIMAGGPVEEALRIAAER